ncbi:hypothetical protein BJY01DRAFT_246931 [Aspergillus pseudoustus]|uniref:Glycine amidinotransferase, mitochondrial n=1 Tax=Aspergillus pseudoustus TaxID=1810923 RepID=A0ABR4K4B6_9EURO
MPSHHVHRFKSQRPFDAKLIAKAEAELDYFASILQAEGVQVYRPPEGVNWLDVNGYTGAMPRDGLMSVHNTLIETCFAWPCRNQELEIAYDAILSELGRDSRVKVIRRPPHTLADTLLDEQEDTSSPWVINNSRPAFDAADFMGFGKTILGQLKILEVDDPHAMHIDATILSPREGLLVYNPKRVTEKALRKHAVLADWDLRPYPFTPKEPEVPPLYMTSPWLCLNALVLDGKRIVVEASD